MSALSIQVPFPVFQDRDGQPLDNGYVWLGTSSLNPQTNPVVAYYDSALTIVATQPLRTLNGFISRAGSPAQVYVDAVNFSILVQDRQGTTVFSVPEGTGISPNASGVVYDPVGTGAVATTVQSKLRESVSVLDFGAVGDGVTDDSAAINAAIVAANANSRVAGGYQIGGLVFFPKGRYLIRSTINLPVGITIAGEPSGLDATNNPTANSTGSQIQVSTTLAANAAGFCPAFTLSNGGPVIFQDIGINGTSGVTQACMLYVGNGAASAPGLTQGHFSNCRFTAFNSVFAGAKMFDCSFYDCGFESNVYGFNFNTAANQEVHDLKFVSCIFFGGTAALMNIQAGTVVKGIVMSACIFQDDTVGAVNMNGFNIFGALSHLSITGCYFDGKVGSFIFSLLATTGSLTDVVFSGNTVLGTTVSGFGNFAAGVQVYYLNFTGNDFRNAVFNAAYSVNNVIFNGNTFRGTSTILVSSLNNLVITGNDFVGCSVNPPIALTDVFANLNLSDNLFATAVTGIPVNATSTYVYKSGNTFNRWTSYTPTLSADTGSWSGSSITAKYLVDGNTLFLNFECTAVSASSPTQFILTLPSGLTCNTAMYGSCLIYNASVPAIGIFTCAAAATTISCSPISGAFSGIGGFIQTLAIEIKPA